MIICLWPSLWVLWISSSNVAGADSRAAGLESELTCTIKRASPSPIAHEPTCAARTLEGLGRSGGRAEEVSRGGACPYIKYYNNIPLPA